MVGNSPLSVDENNNVTERGVNEDSTEGLWEFLTKTNVDRSLAMPYDMPSNKRILESTNGHLTDNDRSGHINTFRGPKYSE